MMMWTRVHLKHWHQGQNKLDTVLRPFKYVFKMEIFIQITTKSSLKNISFAEKKKVE